MFPMATSTSYHHGHLASALLDAATEIAGEDPNGELSLRAVARRAGVSHSAAYRHFADKRALLRALALRGFGELEAILLELRERDDFTMGDVAAAYVGLAQRIPLEFRLMFDGAQCLPPGQPDALTESGIGTRDLLALVLSERYGLAKDEGEAFAFAAWSQMHGVAVLALDSPALRGISGPEAEGMARVAASFLEPKPR